VSTSWLLFMVASGASTAWLAQRKGYRARSWFWLGALLGAIALLVLLLQPSRRGGALQDASAL
jgi:hypothetical protein